MTLHRSSLLFLGLTGVIVVVGGIAAAANHQIRAGIDTEVAHAQRVLAAYPGVEVRDIRYEHGLFRDGVIHYDLRLTPAAGAPWRELLSAFGDAADGVRVQGQLDVAHGPYVPGEGFVSGVVTGHWLVPDGLPAYLPQLVAGQPAAALRAVVALDGSVTGAVDVSGYDGPLVVGNTAPPRLRLSPSRMSYFARDVHRDARIVMNMESAELQAPEAAMTLRGLHVDSAMVVMPEGQWWAMESDLTVDQFALRAEGDDGHVLLDGFRFRSRVPPEERSALIAGESTLMSLTSDVGFRAMEADGERLGETQIAAHFDRISAPALNALNAHYQALLQADARGTPPPEPHIWISLIDALLEPGPRLQSLRLSSRLDNGGQLGLDLDASLPPGLSVETADWASVADRMRASARFSASAPAVKTLAGIALAYQAGGREPQPRQVENYINELRLAAAFIPFFWFDADDGLVAEAWVRDGWIGAGDQRLMPVQGLQGMEIPGR